MGKKQRAWLFVAVWMAVIFFFSAQPSNESSAQSGRVVAIVMSAVRFVFGDQAASALIDAGIELIIRKMAHFTEYTILCFLMARAIRLTCGRSIQFLALPLSSLYAMTDEFHQSFVPGRSMELRDVLIDTAGAALGLLLFYCFDTIRNRQQTRTGAERE
ncbi:MAG: VanZ family protein [Clostridia bacterium]|nr:VanZ family protein [Clostridia bacterium]